MLAYRGIDFGVHWDENYNKIDSVTHSLQQGFTLLPEQYSYPGVGYWLTLTGLTPELTHALVHGKRTPTALRDGLLPVLQGQPFRLRLRRIFAFIAALTALWIYFTVLVWRRSWLEAICATLFFGLSWEMVYHARFIAPDAILMQFGALTFLLLSVAWVRQCRWALYFAAVAAGFGCGSKYPGGSLLLPVLVVIWLVKDSWLTVLRDSLLVLTIFGISYLITTPGTVLQPFAFYNDVSYQMRVYATGWFGYSVRPGLQHLARIVVYFGTQLGSTFRALAIVLSIFCLVGVWAVIKESWRNALIILVFPVVYLLYFSHQAAMIVRNYLVVAPFLFLLMARGVFWVSSRLPSQKARIGLAAGIVFLIAINATDQIGAAETVANRRNVAAFADSFQRYTQAHANRTFLVSPKLERELKARHFWGKNLIAQGDRRFDRPYQIYAAYYSEVVTPYQLRWRTNNPDSFVAVFGPREVNLNYYTGWYGDDRIVCLSPAQVRRNILPDLPLKRFRWIGEISFDGVATGAREPVIGLGDLGKIDFLYVLRVDQQTVQMYWNRYMVGDTAGTMFHTEKGQRHLLAVDIDFDGGSAEAQIDGATVLIYHGPIYPAGISQIQIARNTGGTGYVGAGFSGRIHEVSRQADY
jgi:hypothetical protein